MPSTFKYKALRRLQARCLKRNMAAAEQVLLDHHITWAEDERTAAAKADLLQPYRRTIDYAHARTHKPKPTFLQATRNNAYALATNIKRACHAGQPFSKHVAFQSQAHIRYFNPNDDTPMLTYDSGADGHYLNEADRQSAGLPIIRPSTKRVGVANGGTSVGKHATTLPFTHLSPTASAADSFEDFPTSLMSVGKTADDGTVSIFTKDGVTIHKETDVLITCHGKPLLIGVRDEQGRYRIPLIQHCRQWQPRTPSKKARTALSQANSVYDLPSTEQAIKWMHAVCGYPVRSTWLKAVQAGNFVGWPLLTAKNIQKYYPDSVETPKGHLNQTRKNVRSTKPKPTPFEEPHSTQLRGRKVQDIYTKVYHVRDTIFTDQTGKFPQRSQAGNKYIMVMVDIDSSAILVEPIKNRTDAELTRAYSALMLRLQRAGVTPRKHVLDNEVSLAMKDLIRDKYKMTLELVPPGCHRRNAAEVAIRNFKSHFLSILAGVADDFPLNLWDKLLPQAEITLNLLRQSNATPTVSAYAHLNGPFDYNKMLLAPMGCNAQVHEKTDSRGTWAFHSVDGWYLNTSSEHYRTHRCHIKSTNSERLSDTVHFHHKHITNPSLTPMDKLMAAIADCAHALKGLAHSKGTSAICQLQALLHQASVHGSHHTTRPITPQADLPLPRVQHTPPRVDDPTMRVTRSTSPACSFLPCPPIPRPTRPQRPLTHRKRHTTRQPIPVAPDAPARNTRAQTAATTKLSAPPAHNTRSRVSRIPQPTPIARPKTSRMDRLENEVHKALAVLDKSTGKLLNYRQLLRHPTHQGDWTISSANKFSRLAQGVGGRIQGTDTIRFIRKTDIPHDRRKDVTYGRFVCTVRPEKAEPNRTRFTIGGDRINYPGEVATPTAEMLTAKLLFNSVISTRGGKFMTMDISNFYLMTPLQRPEYLRLKLSDIPKEIIGEYHLHDIAEPDGTIYVLVRLGMYGLPQAGLLANELLEKRLNSHGYRQSPLVPGLWSHEWRPIQFTLVVDDFGVKYVGEEHPQHLLKVLQEHYKVTTEWTGSRYIGITLDWDYVKRRVHLSMPGYVDKALRQFQHAKPTAPQHAPFPSMPINYGAQKQYAKTPSTSPPLDHSGKKFIQQVCGKFLFLGRAVDPTLLCPISAIASQSAKPTHDTLLQTKQLLDYIATQDEAVLTYNASDMVLAIHSDASYLSEPGARSRAGGHFFLSSNAEIPPNNGAVLNIAHIIKHVMASATEAELAALYIMAREAVFIRIILMEMGHTQPATPLQTDNSTADGVVNGKVQPKQTKAMDMRFHWLRDRECQDQFRIYWRPGKLNYADYWTKHHPAAHYQHIRHEFITPQLIVEMLRISQRNKRAAPAA